jgi:hypothetical protein
MNYHIYQKQSEWCKAPCTNFLRSISSARKSHNCHIIDLSSHTCHLWKFSRETTILTYKITEVSQNLQHLLRKALFQNLAFIEQTQNINSLTKY